MTPLRGKVQPELVLPHHAFIKRDFRRDNHIPQRKCFHVPEIGPVHVDYDGACRRRIDSFDVIPSWQLLGMRVRGEIAAPLLGDVFEGLAGEPVQAVDEDAAVAEGGEGAGGWVADPG